MLLAWRDLAYTALPTLNCMLVPYYNSLPVSMLITVAPCWIERSRLIEQNVTGNWLAEHMKTWLLV